MARLPVLAAMAVALAVTSPAVGATGPAESRLATLRESGAVMPASTSALVIDPGAEQLISDNKGSRKNKKKKQKGDRKNVRKDLNGKKDKGNDKDKKNKKEKKEKERKHKKKPPIVSQ